MEYGNYQEFVNETIENYLSFLGHFKDTKLVILSVQLPSTDDSYLKTLLRKHLLKHLTVNNEDLIEKINNAILPDIYERTQINLYFNSQLKSKLESLPNARFCDVTSFSLNDEKSRINDEYFTKTHYHSFKMNPMIQNILLEFLKNTYIE
jgi:hypothetical protein